MLLKDNEFSQLPKISNLSTENSKIEILTMDKNKIIEDNIGDWINDITVYLNQLWVLSIFGNTQITGEITKWNTQTNLTALYMHELHYTCFFMPWFCVCACVFVAFLAVVFFFVFLGFFCVEKRQQKKINK